ncbi:MAG: hypothetical protein ACTTI6_00670 [Treponema sp.]|uniref:hypothetical protein n=1 Tax=Treponema sp. TaxID=166 RepID=UPI003FA1E034
MKRITITEKRRIAGICCALMTTVTACVLSAEEALPYEESTSLYEEVTTLHEKTSESTVPEESAQPENEMRSSFVFGASAFIKWREKNTSYIAGKYKDAGNFDGQAGGALFIEGSAPFIANYYAKLLLTAPLNTAANGQTEGHIVSLEKIYFKSRITDFLYLTAGKTELDTFRRFKKPVGLAALEFLAGDSWAVTLLPYFIEVKDWKDVSFACGISGDFIEWAVNGQVYWERQQNWIGEVQVQYIKNFFTGTLSGTVKQKADNRYFTETGGRWHAARERNDRMGNAFPVYGGVAAECAFTFRPVSFSVGYEFCSEGYTAQEADAFKQAVSVQSAFAEGYREDVFDPHVLNAAFTLHDTVIPNVTLSTEYRLGLPLIGLKAIHRLEYAVNRYFTVELIHELRWSQDGGGYRLFSPFRNSVQVGGHIHI